MITAQYACCAKNRIALSGPMSNRLRITPAACDGLPLRRRRCYWQASHSAPLRMASIEQASCSSAVYSRLRPAMPPTSFFTETVDFLDVRGLECPQIVGRLEADVPRAAIHVAERLHVRLRQEEVDRLRLVDPFLPAGGSVDDGIVADREDGRVFALEVLRECDSMSFSSPSKYLS